jgi:nucleotidyltransferase/DNA polymerase involved in DNA repair
VVYAEVPGFYAQVERAARPELAGRPVVVGGDPRKGGLVQAHTPDAAAHGVAVGMPVLEAIERCPAARALPTDMRRYREVGVRLFACLRRVCERIEEAGLGAAYVELPETADPEAVAAELAQRAGADLGLPLRIGIGPVKFVARLAAREAGDAGLRRVAPGDVQGFLRPLPVSRLDGVGANTQSELAKHDVRTIGDLADLGAARLEEILGNRGLELHALARGLDPSPVRATRHSKSLSQETTLPADQVDTGVLSERIQELAESLERRLALEALAARRVSLKIRYADQETATRSSTLSAPVSESGAIHAVGRALLRRTQAGARAVRLIGLAVSELAPAARDDRQLDLFRS